MNKANIKMLNKNFSPWKKFLWMNSKRTQIWCFKYSGDFLLAKFLMEKEEMLLNILHSRKCGSSLRRSLEIQKTIKPNKNTHRWLLGNSTGFLSTVLPQKIWLTLDSLLPFSPILDNMDITSLTLFKWDPQVFLDIWLHHSYLLEVSQTPNIRLELMLLKKLHYQWHSKISKIKAKLQMSSLSSWELFMKTSI